MKNEKKQLIVFGYGLAIILGLIAFHIWRHHSWQLAHVILFPCIIALILVMAMQYTLLEPLYKQWMRVAHLIGSVITAILLSVLFYLIFGIAGIILRLLRKDLLDQRIDHAASSYWINKDQIDFNKDHYTRQF